jgi:chemotaxis response regulator CheB
MTSIGLICDHSSALLAGRIEQVGYTTVRLDPRQFGMLGMSEIPAADTWVVDCVDTDSVAESIADLDGRLLALSNRPNHNNTGAYVDWCDKIIRTLDKWHADQWQAEKQSSQTTPEAFSALEGVWLLVGSTGATEAIARFFYSLDPVPPVAFIYAQHIDAPQQAMLKSVVRSNKDLAGSLVVGRHWLNPGHVYIVPAASQIKVTSHGEIFSTRETWAGPETPDLNQLMYTLSGMQQAPTGAIMFSGAGEDGVIGLKALAGRGTRIWVQQPDTAAAPSMPSRALDSMRVQKQGSPQELARALLELYLPK